MSRRAWLIVAAVVVVFAAGITVGVAVFDNGSSPGAVTLEPVASTGTDPFTNSVATRSVAMPANVQAITAATRKTLSTNPRTHTLVATGTAPGLYGGSGNTHVCDQQQLVEFLQQHPDKAAAWAGVLGITTSNIANYVATLTPVLLTNDTLVTNHGYRNGRATTLQSVLQAGTAVMVDATGTPRVKCNCGNPLTPADPTVTTARLRGTGWPGYTPTQVTVVNAGPVTQSFTLVNMTTGDTYTQPVGTTGTGLWVAAEFETTTPPHTTNIVTSTDGRAWTRAGVISGEPVHALFGANGTWVAALTNGGDVTSIVESTDLRTWTPVTSVAGLLESIGYGNGRWIAAGVRHPVAGSAQLAGVVYTSTDARTWTMESVPAALQQSEGLAVAYGGSRWLIAAAHNPDLKVPGKERLGIYTSTDGIGWNSVGDLLDTYTAPSLAFGGGTWVSESALPGRKNTVSTSRDGTTWVAATAGPGTPGTGIAYGANSWLLTGSRATTPQPTHGVYSTDYYASTDGNTWSLLTSRPAIVNALAYGPAQAAAPTPTTPKGPVTTTPQGAVSTTLCPWKDEQTGQPNTFSGPAPTSVTLPAGVALPSGGTVYAPGAHALFVAPAGFQCTATTGEDDYERVEIVDPANRSRFVEFNGGGSLQNITDGCSYFPQQRAEFARAAVPGESCPTPPASVDYAALPTGDPGVQAAVVAVPPAVLAPYVNGEAGSSAATQHANDVPTLVLFVARWRPEGAQYVGIGDGLRCALPPAQSAMCVASLQLMLENSAIKLKAPARTALQQFLSAHS